MTAYDVLARRCRRATSMCVVALLLLIVIDTFIASNSARALSVSILLWIVASLPLLIFVPGIRRGAVNSFAWLSFVSLLYFMYGVLAVFASPQRWLSALHLVFAIALFISAMLSVRYTARARRAEPA
jgi:uncharacterized membrane protein